MKTGGETFITLEVRIHQVTGCQPLHDSYYVGDCLSACRRKYFKVSSMMIVNRVYRRMYHLLYTIIKSNQATKLHIVVLISDLP
jgi:hypothetical protein